MGAAAGSWAAVYVNPPATVAYDSSTNIPAKQVPIISPKREGFFFFKFCL